jgi:hypothetical protein
MLGYQAGLWELAVIAGLAGIVFSFSRQHTRQLVGFAGIGIAAALGWVAAVQVFAAPCGFSSEQPVTCSVASAPSVTGYLVASVILAMVGAGLATSVSHAPDSLSR